MTDHLSITFNCGKCGHRISWSDDATEDTQISCANCGEDAGTYGDLHAKGMDAARAKVNAMFKDIFNSR